MHTTFEFCIDVFLAAYTAVNAQGTPVGLQCLFLAAYTAVNKLAG